MLIWKKSAPGTVREENQDALVIDQAQGILILADGSGPNGQQASRQCADFLTARLKKIRHQASIDHSRERIELALHDTHKQLKLSPHHRRGSPKTTISLAFACIVEGHLFLGASGTVGIAAKVGESTITFSPTAPPSLENVSPEAFSPEIKVEGPLPFQSGDWVLAASAGILLSHPFSRMEPLFPKLWEDDNETVEMLFQKASTDYDGDDRTLALARFQTSDQRCLLSNDVTIETSVDRTGTLPLWAAAIVCAIIGAIGLFLHRMGILDFNEE